MTHFNAQKFEEIIKNTTWLKDHIDAPYITNSESFENKDELIEYLQERIGDCDVIYYRTALEFLLEHDCSLGESLEIAHEFGYTTDKLNSELLATLLLQQKLSEELGKTDFSECFEDEGE